MKPFPNMARGPVEGREVLSSDPDTILCRQLPTYPMGPCWHIVVIILSFLKLCTEHVEKALVIGSYHILFYSSQLVLGTHMEIKVTFV